MKSVYRKINQHLIDKLANTIWKKDKIYYKHIKKGILLEGGDKELLKEIVINEVMLVNSIGDSNKLLELNPMSFRATLKNDDKSANLKTSISDKCLYHYSYIGECLSDYYHDGVLDIDKVNLDCLNNEYYIDLGEAFKEELVEKNVDNFELEDNRDLLSAYKGAKSVLVSDAAKIIFVVHEYKDWGYDLNYIGMRYNAYRHDPTKWIDDKLAVDATLKQIKELERTNNAPKQMDVESFLLWISVDLKGMYARNYVQLYDRICFRGSRWHQLAEDRLREKGIYDSFEGYEVVTVEKMTDPIRGCGSWATLKKRYYIGYDYENDRDIYDLYNERYIPWED